MASAADYLFEYLRRVIYEPDNAALDLNSLPEEFLDYGKGLLFYNKLVHDATDLAKELANGNLDVKLPPSSNEIAAPLKMLHASLRHLTWQAQQVAKGDYKQRVDFMGEFSEAFNNMIVQLDKRQKIQLSEKRKLELYVDLLLANSPDPVLLFDTDKKLVYYGDSFLSYSGLTADSGIAGLSVGELLAPYVPDETLKLIIGRCEDALSEKRHISLDLEIDFSRGGEKRHFQLIAAPMINSEKDPADNVDGLIILLHDTTEIVSARIEAERERKLAEKMSLVKSEFLARMSHEMRTPMNAIMGMAAIYEASSDVTRRDYCVSKIAEASRHMLLLINDALDISEIESDAFNLYERRFNFKKMIERAIKSVMFKVEQNSQTFTADIDDNLPEFIYSDESRFAQVLSNLLTNAVKFTPEKGEINFSASALCDSGNISAVRIAVKDNGIGISKEQRERIFIPFEQADGGLSRKYGGTGLGLVITKHIVEMMGGIIYFESEVNAGSTFTCEIPVKKASAPAFAVKSSSAAVSPENADGLFRGYRLLLAEDIQINREIVESLLERTGAAVVSAFDGEDAFAKYAAEPENYDLILMDIHMPNMNGYEATKIIRASGLPKCETIPIIALTANVFNDDIKRCIDAGMNGHLGKPIESDELIARLKEFLL